jgi:hypothetical protein
MRCGVCHATLVVSGYRTKEYRNDAGRVYKTRRSPTYHPCPRLSNIEFHPARADDPGQLQFDHSRRFKSVHDRIVDAEARSSRYLGNYNEEIEAGRTKSAEKMLAKSQYWLDIANKLRGNA